MVSSLKESNKELKSQLRKEKDQSEATNLGMALEDPSSGPLPPPSKHVRIQESDPKSDKSNLLDNCDNNST